MSESPGPVDAGATAAVAARAIRKALLELSVHAPFFATLALFAPVELDEGIETAATDGRKILVSSSFFAGLRPSERRGVVAHEVLHAALLHLSRRGSRAMARWNVAADIVTNGIVRRQGWAELPEGALVEPTMEDLAVEEVYERLPECATAGRLADLRDDDGPGASRRVREAERFWGHARASAAMLAPPGATAGGLERELSRLGVGRVDWRAELARFVTSTRDDFGEIDRRFVHRGLYLEVLESEGLLVDVAIDTSGSIGARLLADFLAELSALVGMFPRSRGRLFFFDSALAGPFPLATAPPRVRGGGGTSFVPFFERLREDEGPQRATAAVILTDGCGVFPEVAPEVPILWVVPPGGAPASAFPFGRVVHIARS